jgi:hypothetical protein
MESWILAYVFLRAGSPMMCDSIDNDYPRLFSMVKASSQTLILE